mmetsp:Transcript_7017/g.8894  ORF Transcript_7017/g.8894 Transcript_7017/m.8894 type:complete len:362 (+) Transcript_7017:31-1116(+)
MIELHVWGHNSSISVISPECLASSWLLNLQLKPQNIPFKIVTSSNTNLSQTDKLPLLLVPKDESTNDRYEGFQNISQYISRNFNMEHTSGNDIKYLPNQNLTSAEQKLINSSLTSFIENTIHNISQYNLYINTNNYEKYTRKLFQKFFPFPMMYNQPLKFYHAAQKQVQVIGLNSNNPGFFSISGSDAVAQTEYFNDENDDEESEGDPVAISSLHEKQLLAKSKRKDLLKESKNSLKCLNLVNEYIDYIVLLYKELNASNKPDEFSYLFPDTKDGSSNAVSSSELQLFAYIHSLCLPELPDKFIANYLTLKYPKFLAFIYDTTSKLNESLYKDKSIFREPQGIEVPNLWNELKYSTGYVKY